jgi:hypothetical protein
MQYMKDMIDIDSLEYKFPDCCANHILSLFFESGMASSGMGGMESLTWKDILAWIDCTQRELTLWETHLIRDMSVAYVGEYNLASDPNHPEPYSIVVTTEAVRAKAASQVKSLFARLKEKQKE